MKKLVSLALALVMILSLSVTAYATTAPETLYVDIGSVLPSNCTVSSMYIDVNDSGIDFMTHVSGTIYSYDTSSIGELTEIEVMVSYNEVSGDRTYTITTFEEGKNLLTLTDVNAGTWSTYPPASATPAGPSVTNGSQNVTGKYVAGAVSGIIYKVDIAWGSMAFTYTAAGKGNWNTTDHVYKDATAAAWSWEDGANEITVTNHSNDGITVTPSYTADTSYESASMTFDNASLTLTTADNGEGDNGTGKATGGTITVTPGGSVPEGTSGKIGKITLSLSGQPVEVSDEESLVAALNAGRTAKLVGDFSVSNAITVSASSVLDLNGHVLSTSNPLNVATGGSLTVMDSASGGKLTSTAPAIQNQGGTLVVNSGTIESSNNVVTLYGGTTQLNGGTFHCTGSSFVVLVNSSLNGLSITGGSYTGGQYSVFDPYYSFTITGGTFENGFFTPVAANAITVTGGTYSFDPAAYIDAAVSYIQSNDNGTYTVLPRDENTTVPINQTVDTLAKLTSVTKTGGTATLSSSLTNEGLKVTETQTLADGVNLTLDVNGKALQATGLAPIFSVPSTATLTITNSSSTQGYVNINGNAGAVITVDGTLYVKGGQVSCGAQYSIEVSESGNAEITGGLAYTVGTSGTVTLSGGSSNAVYVNGGKTTVSGGTVNAVIQVTGGTLDVTSGSVSVINATAGTVTVSGGTITSTIVAGGTSSITITGGTITGSLNQNGTGTLTITGGTFSNDPSAYVPEGCTVTTNDDGTYTVTANS